MFIHYRVFSFVMQGICSHWNHWIHSIFYYTMLWHSSHHTFFSYTTPLYKQLKLQHAATTFNKRQNTDHCMAEAWMVLNKVIFWNQFWEDVGVRSPISGQLKYFAEGGSFTLTSVEVLLLGQKEQLCDDRKSSFLLNFAHESIPFPAFCCLLSPTADWGQHV